MPGNDPSDTLRFLHEEWMCAKKVYPHLSTSKEIEEAKQAFCAAVTHLGIPIAFELGLTDKDGRPVED